MNTPDKKHSFFDDYLSFFQTEGKPFISSKMKILTLLLLLFSGLFLTIEAHTQQVPAKPKAKVVAMKSASPATTKGKKKAKKMKKVVIKKDTMPEIDPANTNSPLFEKN